MTAAEPQSTGRKWFWRILRIGVTVAALGWVFLAIQDELHDRVVLMAEKEGGEPRDVQLVKLRDGGADVLENGQTRFVPGEDLVRIEPSAVGRERAEAEPVVKVGLLNVLGHIRWGWLVASVLLFCGVPFFASLRWRELLHVQKVSLSVPTVMRLTWIGLFCNQFMPGMTGGDLVKAYYVTRHTATSKAESAITILVDRIIGLLGLLWVSAAAMGLILLFPPAAGSAAGLPWAWLLPAPVVLIGAGVFYSRWLRRVFRINVLLKKCKQDSMIRRLDRAVLLYRDHKKTIAIGFGLTFLSHVCLLGAVHLGTFALSLEVPLLHTVTFAALIFVATGLIPAVAGVGPLEMGFVLFFANRGYGTQALSFALALIARLENVLWSLPGAVLMMLGGQPSRAAMQREMEQQEDSAPPADPTDQ